MINKWEGFLNDITPEEIVIIENAIVRFIPNSERVCYGALAWLAGKQDELKERGEVATCYSEATQHAQSEVALHLPRQRQPDHDSVEKQIVS